MIILYYRYVIDCWRWCWLIEKPVDEFVIEKYIEIIKGININIMYKFILIQILTLLVLLDNGTKGSTFIYL